MIASTAPNTGPRQLRTSNCLVKSHDSRTSSPIVPLADRPTDDHRVAVTYVLPSGVGCGEAQMDFANGVREARACVDRAQA
jgi:hypothetical protein